MSRPLSHMTDVPGARRMLLMWVPKWASRWKVHSWGFTLGRLWVQLTPPPETAYPSPVIERRGDLYRDALNVLYNHDPLAGEHIKSYVYNLEEWCGSQHR